MRPAITAAVLASTIGVLAMRTAIAADDLKGILKRAGERTLTFEQAFGFVLSDERYGQSRTRSRVIGGASRTLDSEARTMQSEMLFTYVPEDREWLTVRSVLSVDGGPVADSRERL